MRADEVIAGSRKGHRIDAPRGLDTRPTSDRVRENVFNLVQAWVEDAVVLDLFAGSGAMGIEALSRGAERAVFVESQQRGVPRDRAQPRQAAPHRRPGRVPATSRASSAADTRAYDLVFCDPPYEEYADARAGARALRRRACSPTTACSCSRRPRRQSRSSRSSNERRAATAPRALRSSTARWSPRSTRAPTTPSRTGTST